MALELKSFLDYEGLSVYDELIKEYINSKSTDGSTATQAVAQALAELTQIYETAAAAQDAKIQANEDAITKLNGDKTVEGSVANIVDTVVGEATQEAVDTAIANLVDNAPEALDTLKEIADWIANDETGTAALIARVDDAEDAIEANTAAIEANKEACEAAIVNIKEYSDAQDKYFYDKIDRIEDLKIAALFPVVQSATQSAEDAITAVEEYKAVKLTANQTISEDLTIDKSCYIDANGSTFEGNVTVPADKDVIIVNATFANPVVVA